MHQTVPDPHVERAVLPGNDLYRAEALPELTHESAGELERLRLVAALGAVGDTDLERRAQAVLDPPAVPSLCRAPPHVERPSTIARSSRTTSLFARSVVSSRIFCSCCCSRARTSSGSWSTGASGEPNSGCAAKTSRRLRARSSVTPSGRSMKTP